MAKSEQEASRDKSDLLAKKARESDLEKCYGEQESHRERSFSLNAHKSAPLERIVLWSEGGRMEAINVRVAQFSTGVGNRQDQMDV